MSFLSETLPDPTKLQRFTGFRKTYYEAYYAEKFAPGRSIATEAK